MKIQNPESKNAMLTRLRRIEGQVRGVQGMINEERDCREVLQQLAAIRSAVQGASMDFLQQYASECLLNPDLAADRTSRETLVKDLVALIGKAP
jgi:CsoR family transcriptional regulator, copper-sensing transcriptional repressor